MLNKIYLDMKLVDGEDFTIEKRFISSTNISKITIYSNGISDPKEIIYTMYNGNDKLFTTDMKAHALEIETQNVPVNNSFAISNKTSSPTACNVLVKSSIYITNAEDRILITLMEQPRVSYIEIYNEDDLVE